jgi:hypothetical protein
MYKTCDKCQHISVTRNMPELPEDVQFMVWKSYFSNICMTEFKKITSLCMSCNDHLHTSVAHQPTHTIYPQQIEQISVFISIGLNRSQ